MANPNACPALRSFINVSGNRGILSAMPVVLCMGVEEGLLITRKVMLEHAGHTVGRHDRVSGDQSMSALPLSCGGHWSRKKS
jgi:hypothetical protein